MQLHKRRRVFSHRQVTRYKFVEIVTNEKETVNDKKLGSMPGENYEKFFLV